MPVLQKAMRWSRRGVSLIAWSCFAGAVGWAQPAVRWIIRIPEATPDIVQVRAEIPRELLVGRSEIEFQFQDRLGTPSRLRSITARAGEVELAVDANGDDGRRIRLGNEPKAIVIEYTIVPTYPYGSAQRDLDARSRVSLALAVLRTASVFARTNLTAKAHVRFVLPPGWVAVTPWAAENDGLAIPFENQSQVEYIGLGPFEIREIGSRASLRIGALPSQRGPGVETVAAIVEREISFFGRLPFAVGSLVIVPPSFMSGGASGAHSAVQGPQLDTLAHEVFHWWNSAAVTLGETGWFREGVTTLYGLRFATESGAFSEAQRNACLADLNAEMRLLEADHAVSLGEASSKSRERAMERLMYSKGALFALMMERRLEANGRRLDEGVRAVLNGVRTGLNNDELKRVFSGVYGDLVDEYFDSYVMKAMRLPEMELGASSTGASGCAYFRQR